MAELGPREEQARLDNFQRALSSLYRMTSLLPPEEARRLKAIVDQKITPKTIAQMDLDRVREVAKAIHQQVQSHLEGERAKAQLDEAKASYALETAEGAMLACSLFGGKGVQLAYQATTGYLEGGAKEAILKAASWLSTPSYVAAQAIRTYESERSAGKVLEAAIKAYAIARAFEKGAKLARTALAPAPTKEIPRPELDLSEFKRLRAEGIAKVQDFAQLVKELKRAGEAGAPPRTIARLQDQIKRLAAAVNSDPHAKNYLKHRGDPYAQRAYNAHMRAIHAEVEAKFHEKMAQRGWEKVQLREFRNASIGNSVGMDYDVGIDHDTARRLIKNGKRASPFEWQAEAQRAWEEAYREVTGHSAKISWENVTTPFHPEAYRDLAWLSPDKSQVRKAWTQQAADVTRYKNWHLLNDPGLERVTALQEASRGTAKDIKTKLLPLLQTATSKATTESARRMELFKRRWEEIASVLEGFGRDDIDSIEASRRIRSMTGRDVKEVLQDASYALEALGKAAGR